MTLEEYRKRYTQDDAVGWQCIDAQLAKVHGGRAPRHYAAPLHFIAGGTDPLDGTSYYDHPGASGHIHVVRYCLSELYTNEDAAGQDRSPSRYLYEQRRRPVGRCRTVVRSRPINVALSLVH